MRRFCVNLRGIRNVSSFSSFARSYHDWEFAIDRLAPVMSAAGQRHRAHHSENHLKHVFDFVVRAANQPFSRPEPIVRERQLSGRHVKRS